MMYPLWRSRSKAEVGRGRDFSSSRPEATARARTLAEGLAMAVGSARSAQAVALQQRARTEGMFCLLCDFVFVFILLLVSEEYCPAVFRVRDGS
jgi:hypothetical protein